MLYGMKISKKQLEEVKKEIDKCPPLETKAKRYSIGCRLDLLHPEFIEAMGTIMCVGASKYGERNWMKGLKGENGGVNHALKHLMEYMSGVKCDYGERKMHLAQVAVNAMFEFYHSDENLKENK